MSVPRHITRYIRSVDLIFFNRALYIFVWKTTYLKSKIGKTKKELYFIKCAVVASQYLDTPNCTPIEQLNVDKATPTGIMIENGPRILSPKAWMKRNANQ